MRECVVGDDRAVSHDLVLVFFRLEEIIYDNLLLMWHRKLDISHVEVRIGRVVRFNSSCLPGAEVLLTERFSRVVAPNDTSSTIVALEANVLHKQITVDKDARATGLPSV